jgi:hypothetical protein
MPIFTLHVMRDLNTLPMLVQAFSTEYSDTSTKIGLRLRGFLSIIHGNYNTPNSPNIPGSLLFLPGFGRVLNSIEHFAA